MSDTNEYLDEHNLLPETKRTAMTTPPRDEVKRMKRLWIDDDAYRAAEEAQGFPHDDLAVEMVLASDLDAAIQQAVAAQREQDAKVLENSLVDMDQSNNWSFDSADIMRIAQAIRSAGGTHGTE